MVESDWPQSFQNLMGPQSMMMVNGAQHTKQRRILMQVRSPRVPRNSPGMCYALMFGTPQLLSMGAFSMHIPLCAGIGMSYSHVMVKSRCLVSQAIVRS